MRNPNWPPQLSRFHQRVSFILAVALLLTLFVVLLTWIAYRIAFSIISRKVRQNPRKYENSLWKYLFCSSWFRLKFFAIFILISFLSSLILVFFWYFFSNWLK